jgi:hypothetical protein
MTPGTMPLDVSKTVQHCNTHHLGRAKSDGTSCFVEVGVIDWINSGTIYGPWFFIYNHDATHGTGSYSFYGNKANLSSPDTYAIQLDGSSDSDGWHYDVWIDSVWKLSGHLEYKLNTADVSNEIWSDTGTYSQTTAADFQNCYITDSNNNWIFWNTNIGYTYTHWAPIMGYSIPATNPYEFRSWTN